MADFLEGTLVLRPVVCQEDLFTGKKVYSPGGSWEGMWKLSAELVEISSPDLSLVLPD